MINRGFAGVLVLGMLLTALSVFAPVRTAAASSPPPALAPAPSTLSPDLGWTSPFALEAQAPTSANLGSVALSGDHSGMIVWEKDGSRARIEVTRFIPGGGAAGTDWQVPVTISSGSCNNWAPSVAMDATGDAIAVWYDSCNYAIHASRFQPGTGWSTPVGIDQPYWLSVSPQIAMNSAGVAFVTWEAWDGALYHVFANRFVPATGWGSAILLDSTTNATSGANVGVDGSGNAIVTWYRYDSPTYHVYAARFNAATPGWGTPVLLETSLNYAIYPTVGMDSLGNAVVAWIQYDAGYNIWANRYDRLTGWTGAVMIESQPNPPLFEVPRVSANNGSAVVAWSMYGPGTDPYSVWANRYTSGVGWGIEADIDGVGGTSYEAHSANVALDSHGNASVVYQLVYLTGTPANQVQLYGVRYSALTGAFSAWQGLDYARIAPGAPLIAMDSGGDALVTWNYNDNPDTTPARNGILANRYTLGVGWRYYPGQQAEWDESLTPSWLQLESNAAGDAIYSWTQNDGPVWNGYAALYTPSAGWGPATRIENLDLSSVAEEWSDIDGHGNAIVLFKVSDGVQYNVYASYYSTGTGWGVPHRVDSALGSSKYWLRISMNAYGDGFAVWNDYNGTNWQAYGAFFNGTTQTWGAAAQIPTGLPYIGTMAGGIDGRGNALAVYQAWNGSAYGNYASYYTVGSGWGSPVHISLGASSEGVVYAVAMNERGDAAVSWNQWSGAHWDVVADTFSPATGWVTAAVLSAGPGDANPAIPSVDGAGNTMVAYQLFDGTRWNVYAVTHDAGGAWGASMLLNGGSGDATGIVSAVDHRGNGYAAWVQYNGNGYDILARRYLAGQGWLPATVVNSPAPATPATNTGTTNLAVDGHGNAILGWNQWQGGVLVPFAAQYIVGDGRPNLAVATPTDGTLTQNPSVIVSGTTDPGAAVTVDGASVSVGADGSFSRSFTLADGAHTFTVVARNAAGLTQTETRTVTIDTSAPALTVSTPSSGTLTNNPAVQVGGTAEAGATVHVNGVNAAVSSAGEFSVSIPLQEGLNTITVTATDQVGNSASTTVEVTLDTHAPALALFSPSTGLTSHASVVVAGTTEPGATLTVDGTAASVDSGGAFSTTVTLSDGPHVISVVATDASGNEATVLVQVTVDTTAPTITIGSPSAGDSVSSAAVTVTGTTDPGATVVVNGYAVSAGSSGSFSVQLPLSPGANTITATATDLAGNSASTSVTVTYVDPLPAAQSSIGSLNTMNLLLIVLVIASLGIGVFEMIQMRKLRGGRPPQPKTEGPSPPKDDL